MAQIHALLFITGETLSMDDICERLQISRGNASMNLRNLMDWGVIKRFRKGGERHDTYVSDTDAVTMVGKVIRERKRREIDPTVDVLADCLALAKEAKSSEETDAFRERISGLLEVFDTIDMAFKYAFATDNRLRQIVDGRQDLKDLLTNLHSSIEKSS